MIAQGTDGLSRADHSTGVMQGFDIRGWIPLHLSVLDRESRLAPWLRQLTQGLIFETLDAEGWFTTGHGRGNFIWSPPPAAAEVVIEQLGKARL
jgi:hypothetical protein